MLSLTEQPCGFWAGMFNRFQYKHDHKTYQLLEVAVRDPDTRVTFIGASALVSDKTVDTYRRVFDVLRDKVGAEPFADKHRVRGLTRLHYSSPVQ